MPKRISGTMLGKVSQHDLEWTVEGMHWEFVRNKMDFLEETLKECLDFCKN